MARLVNFGPPEQRAAARDRADAEAAAITRQAMREQVVLLGDALQSFAQKRGAREREWFVRNFGGATA